MPDFATGYSDTRVTRSNGMTSLARYRQGNLSGYYALSKRTDGNTLGTAGSGHIISATATIGGGFQSAPSSSRSQFAADVGRHRAPLLNGARSYKKERLVLASLFAVRRPP